MAERNSARWGRGTIGAIVLIGIVLPVLLAATVLLRGGRNLHSSMQYWAGLNFLIQSIDPTYQAIQDREDDIREIQILLWPREGSRERAVEFYESWRAAKDWALFDYRLKSLEESEGGNKAVAVHELKSRYFPENPDPTMPTRKRTERQESRWIRRGGHWYLQEQTREVTNLDETPIRGVIKP